MTNGDYIRSRIKIPEKTLIEIVEGAGCDKCKAKKLCKSEYPDGTCDSLCKKTIRKWLKMERKA